MLAEDFTQANEVQELLAELKRAYEGKPFSDVIDDQGNQYVDLVMEGGGVLGVALVGYTYVLEEMGSGSCGSEVPQPGPSTPYWWRA